MTRTPKPTARRQPLELSLKAIAEASGLSQAEVRRTVNSVDASSVTDIAVALLTATLQSRESAGNDSQPVSISELHRLTGLDRATIANRLEELEPLPGKKNAALYQWEEALPLLFVIERNLEAVKIRKMDAEADMKEMDAAKMRGDLASREEFTDVLQRMMSNFHKRMVNQLPTELAEPLLQMTTPAEVRSFLKKRIGGEFDRLRDHHTDFL